MLRKILVGLLLIALLVAGISWYRASHNTPQAVVKRFASQLAEGKTDEAYRRLTADLTKGRETYWRDYLKQLATATPPVFSKEEQVADPFNTYRDNEDPRRFTYTFHLKDKDYQLMILLVKEGKSWRVDELHGSATP